MSNSKILYLSHSDVEKAAPNITSLIDLLEQAFIEKGEGRVEMPAKIGIHTQPEALSHAMPAYIPELKAAGMKWVSAYPENNERGLPSISGLVILNDIENGFPGAIMDATWITAYRTAAASALSAKFFARPDSETLGILACGVQARAHLETMASIFSLRSVYAFDINPEVQKRFTEEMSKRVNIEITGAKTPRDAITNSDLILTAGPISKNPAAIIQPDWLKPGVFATSVDFGAYWAHSALAKFRSISTDDLPQYQKYREAGYFHGLPEANIDLGDVVTGKVPGRQTAEELTFAINLGLAIEDIALARLIFKRASVMGLGIWLPR